MKASEVSELLSLKASTMLALASIEASASTRPTEIRPIHLLSALLMMRGTVAQEILEDRGVTLRSLRITLEAYGWRERQILTTARELPLSTASKRILDDANRTARRKVVDSTTTTYYVLRSLIDAKDYEVQRVFELLGVKPRSVVVGIVRSSLISSST